MSNIDKKEVRVLDGGTGFKFKPCEIPRCMFPCLGVVKNSESNYNPVLIYHTVQRKHNFLELTCNPLDQVKYLRSPSCTMILLPELEQTFHVMPATSL